MKTTNSAGRYFIFPANGKTTLTAAITSVLREKYQLGADVAFDEIDKALEKFLCLWQNRYFF